MSDNFANNSNMTALMTAIGNKIKAAGYTIYNAAGTALTRRSKLKFTGEAKATDDSVNGQTIVDVSPQYIDWDDWCAMTEQQQAAIPEAVIENAPGVEGGLSADLLTKLWENYDPNISFARQNITLASSDYDFLLIEYILNCTFAIASRKSVIVPKGFPAALDNVNTQANQTYVRVSTRSIRYTNNTTLQVDDALTQVSGAARETNNDYLIPTAIYGIKSSVNLKFSAIASDVSTSADKCMMSDGVTSVEDAITNREIKFITHTGTTDETANLILPLTKGNARVLAAYGIGEGTATLKSLIGGLAMMTTGGNWFVHVIDYRGTARTSEEVSITVAYIDLQE